MMDYKGILFRIEDVSGFDSNLRLYNPDIYNSISIDGAQFDKTIATMIRNEVNGAKSRNLHSYSKSLATCLLKYNKYTDNELHVFIDNAKYYDKVFYSNYQDIDKIRDYSIMDRVNDNCTYLNEMGPVQLQSFVIDVSDNTLTNRYLRKYTGVGLKKRASPEKDKEVVIFNPLYDIVVKKHMDAMYVIYALQMKYGFLNNEIIKVNLMNDIYNIDARMFDNSENERIAICEVIKYLATYMEWEKSTSEAILKESEHKVHLSMYYDAILQYHGIQCSSIEATINIIDFYNFDVISDLALKYCYRFLKGIQL